MKIKKIFALTAAMLAAFCLMNVACAGLFGFSGGTETQTANQTYVFDGYALDLPENASISNFTGNNNEYTVNSYVISYPNESILIDIATRSGGIESSDEYAQSWVDSNGASLAGEYGNWTIIDLSNATSSVNGDTLHGYIIVTRDGSSLFEIQADNLDELKRIADTFRKA